MAFLLVIAGAMVTSNDAAGAIPDWPLSWGKVVPPLEGGIVYAWAHRVLAGVVAGLTFLLAWRSGSRPAWIAFAMIVAQALVGGLMVRIVAPKVTTVLHACLAQACFGALVWHTASSSGRARLRISGPQGLAVMFLFCQTILGAALRHQIIGAVPHIAGAVITAIIVLWAVVPVMLDHMPEAGALLGITAFQIFLGMGAYFTRTVDTPQPLPMTIWFTAAHVAVGSLAFGAAIVLALVVYWQHSEGSVGGTAIA